MYTHIHSVLVERGAYPDMCHGFLKSRKTAMNLADAESPLSSSTGAACGEDPARLLPPWPP